MVEASLYYTLFIDNWQQINSQHCSFICIIVYLSCLDGMYLKMDSSELFKKVCLAVVPWFPEFLNIATETFLAFAF